MVAVIMAAELRMVAGSVEKQIKNRAIKAKVCRAILAALLALLSWVLTVAVERSSGLILTEGIHIKSLLLKGFGANIAVRA
jgi:hypothetical protein